VIEVAARSFAWMAVALLWGGPASALEAGGLTLETGSPDALCPELEATREIVARRLGALVVEGRKGWRARYTIGHTPAGSPRDFVRLELFNPEGRAELLRDLPIEGDSCRTMSEVIALVLDRYFRGLVAAEQAPQEAPVVPTAQPALPLAARAEREPALEGAAGISPRASIEYATSAARPWLGLRLGVQLSSHLEVGAGLRLGLSRLEERDPRGARIEARTVGSRVSLAWTLALPPGVLRLGPTASLGLQRATTEGLAHRTDRTRALWMTGVEAGFRLPVSARFFLEASSAFDVLLPGVSGRLFVEGREVLVAPSLTFGGALAFGYAWNK
jgi:hypothetical protein